MTVLINVLINVWNLDFGLGIEYNMYINGVISKVLRDKIEFMYSPKDESEENCGNSYDKSKIKFGSGPAPLHMIQNNAPLFVEIKNRRIKDIYIIKDSKVDVYYGKIVKRLDEENYLIQHSLNFLVPISKLTAKGKPIQHEDIERFGNSWIRIYTESNLNILEAQFIEEFERLTVVLDKFNIDSQNREETEIVHFKDSHSFSHYISKNNVFYYNETNTISPKIIKQLIGRESEIFLRNNELIAYVKASSSQFGISEINQYKTEVQNHEPINLSDYSEHYESKLINDRSAEDSYKNEGSQAKVFNEAQENSIPQYYSTSTSIVQENNYLPEKGKIIYDSRIMVKIDMIDENLWKNEKFDQYSNNLVIFIGILDVFCRKTEYNSIWPLINQLSDYVNRNSHFRDYLQMVEYLKFVNSIPDINLRFYYCYELIFTNLEFFNLLANNILENHDFDFFYISQTYKLNLLVYEKIDERVIRHHYDLIKEDSEAEIKADYYLCFYTDYKQVELVYSADQMAEDNYENIQFQPFLTKTNPSDLYDLLDQSLNQISTITPPKLQLPQLNTFIETLKNLKSSLAPSSQKSLLTKAYSKRLHLLSHN